MLFQGEVLVVVVEGLLRRGGVAREEAGAGLVSAMADDLMMKK